MPKNKYWNPITNISLLLSIFWAEPIYIENSNDIFVIGWGSANTDTAIMSEVDFKNDKVLSELHFIDDKKQAYRVYKFK